MATSDAREEARSYDWREFEGAPLAERFPDWARGAEDWRRFAAEPTPRGLEELRTALARTPPPACPRVFVSHRRPDDQEALRVAELATQEGFNFWLDVLEPQLLALATPAGLATPPHRLALLTAGIIEMGLAHASHVCAVFTPRTPGSLWVPYEYGRVADPGVPASTAGAWIDPAVPDAAIPEYMLLGETPRSEPDLVTWLRREFGGWQRDNAIWAPPCPRPAAPWTYGPTLPLP